MRVILVFSVLFVSECSEWMEPSVMVALFARNKAHTLPYFLSLFENLDYPKSRMSLWIKTDHNIDKTSEILTIWMKKWRKYYHSAKLLVSPVTEGKYHEDETSVHHWSKERFKHIIALKEEALNKARNKWADYIWYLDCDVFLTNNQTLRLLISQGVTVIAPLINSLGFYSNFWAGMNEDYYYLRTEDYKPILERKKRGNFAVPMVHSAVLIDLRRRGSLRLSFHNNNLEGYDGPVDDIIVFAVSAKFADVPLYITNTEDTYGYMPAPLTETDSLETDYQQVTSVRLSALVRGDRVSVSEDLSKFTEYPVPDKMGLDEVYLINLVRRPERRHYMEECFKELGIKYKYIPAVDGRRLNQTYLDSIGLRFLEEFKDPYHKRVMTYGEIGCFLSHYNIWKDIVDRKLSKVVVFEDDINFEPYFRRSMRYLLHELNTMDLSWDLVYLGRKRLEDDEELVDGSNYLVHPSYSYWTLSYLIAYQGALNLLQEDPISKILPVDEYLPIMFNKHPEKRWSQHFQNRNLKAFSVNPLLVYPIRYTGESGYISDTDDSNTITLKNTPQHHPPKISTETKQPTGQKQEL